MPVLTFIVVSEESLKGTGVEFAVSALCKAINTRAIVDDINVSASLEVED